MASRKAATATATAAEFEIGGAAAPAAITREEELEAQIAELKAQLANGKGSTKSYPESQTPRGVADSILAMANAATGFVALPGADFIRDLHSKMVQRVPNTVKADSANRFGEPVLIKGTRNQDLAKMLPVFGEQFGDTRDCYIKLGKLAAQLYGDPNRYRKSQPLSETQITGILLPCLDFLAKHEVVTWKKRQQ